ncbi:MAG: sortase [Propionibacteriaceae bacterium]|nr:sortase [Propionibacteriaceae bacterium]
MTNSPDTPQPRPPKKPPRRHHRAWGWLVVLVVVILVVGGVFGTLLVSNAVTTSKYADSITSDDNVGSLSCSILGSSPVPIVSGTSFASLRHGVGWYEGSALPGQVGNFAVAGHRLGWGQPFAHLDRLQVGDQLQVTAQGTTYTYTVITGPTVVSDKQSDALASVPAAAGRVPSKALLTLTTAASLLPSPHRLVVVAELTSTK